MERNEKVDSRQPLDLIGPRRRTITRRGTARGGALCQAGNRPSLSRSIFFGQVNTVQGVFSPCTAVHGSSGRCRARKPANYHPASRHEYREQRILQTPSALQGRGQWGATLPRRTPTNPRSLLLAHNETMQQRPKKETSPARKQCQTKIDCQAQFPEPERLPTPVLVRLRARVRKLMLHAEKLPSCNLAGYPNSLLPTAAVPIVAKANPAACSLASNVIAALHLRRWVPWVLVIARWGQRLRPWTATMTRTST